MSREFGDYIADILDSAREVEEFTRGMDFEAFVADKKTVNAVIRSLEVMGRRRSAYRSGSETSTPTSHGSRWPACGTSSSTSIQGWTCRSSGA